MTDTAARKIPEVRPGTAAEAALGPEFYDGVYRTQAKYRGAPDKAGYFPLWQKVMSHVDEEAFVLEIGCGTGQLAEMLYEKGIREYRGFDFSEVGLDLARKRVPDFEFEDADARDSEPYDDQDYDVAIAVEVFEHLDDDLQVIQNLPQGTRLVFSVPSRDSKSHVRFFGNQQAVHDYYGAVVHGLTVESVGYWFVGVGHIL